MAQQAGSRPATSSKVSVANWLFLLGIALLPLVFFPFTIEPFFTPKIFLFMLIALGVFLAWIANTWKTRQVQFAFTPLTIAVLGFAVVATISALLTVNPAAQFTNRLIIWWSSTALILFGTSLNTKIRWSHILQALLLGSTLLALGNLSQYGPIPLSKLVSSTFGVQIDPSPTFSLSGSLLATAQLLLPVSLAAIVGFFEQRRHSSTKSSTPFIWLGLGILALAVSLLSVWSIMNSPDSSQLLPFRFGWNIMVESFKQPKLFFIGIGPENFLQSFHLFRDASYNVTPFWQLRFNASSSEITQLVSTLGILGFASFVVLGYIAMRRAIKLPGGHSLVAFLVGLLVVLVFSPATMLTWMLLGLAFLAINLESLKQVPTKVKHVQLSFTASTVKSPSFMGFSPSGMNQKKGFVIITCLLLFVLMITSLVWVSRVFAAQVFYYSALRAASQNDGLATYNNQIISKRLQPMDPAYHRGFAATSLNIASNLVQQQQDKPDENNQQMVLQLVQQAIQEGRLSVTLDPNSTENWEALSAIYDQLLGFEGASQWALAAHVTAVQTDPISPTLRLALGDLYLQGNATPSAQTLYEQTIQLKPDWAVAFTRYGAVLELENQPSLALQAYQKAQTLLPSDTPQDQKDQLTQKISSLQKTVDELAQKNAATTTDKKVPNPGSPSVPQNPELNQAQTPQDYDQVVNGGAESTASQSGEIVLPKNVGI